MGILKSNTDLSVPRKADGIHVSIDQESFGRASERVAHSIGTAKFLAIQTVIVVVWMVWNRLGPEGYRFDTEQFILLNLVFSTQAAYAAPLILLAETRQADRDRAEAAEDRRRNTEQKADLDYIARELASIRVRVVDHKDLERVESKLNKLLEAIETKEQ